MFLAELIGFTVLDSRDTAYRLVDLAIDANSAEEPVVRRLHLRPDRLSRRVVEVPSTLVERIDVFKRLVRVAGDPRADAPEVVEPSMRLRRGRAPLLRLRQDVLDALVIDLRGRRATRINDLWLDADEHGIRLLAADLGVRGMLRRLSRGRIARGQEGGDLVGWEWIEFFRGDLATARAAGDRHDRLGRLPVAEIARLAEALPYPMTTELIGLLPPPVAADALEALSIPRQLQVLESLTLVERGAILGRVAAHNAASVLAEFDPATATAILDTMPRDRRDLVVELLRYPRDSVGAVMTNEIAVLPPGLTVGRAVELLRDRLADPDFVYFVYVADRDDRLQGVVTLRALLVSQPATAVDDLMNRRLETVHALDPAVAAARRVVDTQLLALPVVGLDDRLIGALTIDASVRLVAPYAWRQQAPTVFS